MIRSFALYVLLAASLFGADKVITIQDDKVGIGVGETVPTHKLQVKGGDVLIEENITVQGQVDLRAGSIENTEIGQTTPANGRFDLLEFNTLGTELNATMFNLPDGYLMVGDAVGTSMVHVDTIANLNNNQLNVQGAAVNFNHIQGVLPESKLPNTYVTANDPTITGGTIGTPTQKATGNFGILNVDSLNLQGTFYGEVLDIGTSVSFPDKSIQASDLQLAENQIFIGDNVGKAAPQNVGGDLSVNAAGVFSISDDSVTSAKIDNDTILSEDIFDHTITGNDLAPELTGIDINGGNIDGVVIGAEAPGQAAFSKLKTAGNIIVGGDFEAGIPSDWTRLNGLLRATQIFSEDMIGVGYNANQSEPLGSINSSGRIKATELQGEKDGSMFFQARTYPYDGAYDTGLLLEAQGGGTPYIKFTADGVEQARIQNLKDSEMLRITTKHPSIALHLGDKRLIEVGDPVNSDDAVNLGYLQNYTIGNSQLGNDSVTAAKIANNAVGYSEIATDAVRAEEIAANAVGYSEIATNAVRAEEIAANSVGNSEMQNDAIGNAEMRDNAIGSAEVINNSLTSSDIADSITFTHLTINNTSGAEIDMNNKKITELATPTAGTDAANKEYVDDAINDIENTVNLLNVPYFISSTVSSSSATINIATVGVGQMVSFSGVIEHTANEIVSDMITIKGFLYRSNVVKHSNPLHSSSLIMGHIYHSDTTSTSVGSPIILNGGYYASSQSYHLSGSGFVRTQVNFNRDTGALTITTQNNYPSNPRLIKYNIKVH